MSTVLRSQWGNQVLTRPTTRRERFRAVLSAERPQRCSHARRTPVTVRQQQGTAELG